MNDMTVYEAEKALVKPKGKNYVITVSENLPPVNLVRDEDFGVIPKTKKPTLYKSGAEKIAMGYGLLQHYDIESKIENIDSKAPVFFYTVKCSLVKVGTNGQEYVFTTGYGSANTNEKRNGFNSAWDAANGTLKMAQKRALVAAAISISGMSGAFTQDMENEDFMAKGVDLMKTDQPESIISAAQIRRIYAIGGNAGLTVQEVKDILAEMGFTSTKQIQQKDYEKVCETLEKRSEK